MVSGHRYNAGENGKIVTNDFWTTALGNKVYSNDNGRIVTKKLFTAVPDGKKYYAVKSGKIVSGKTITWKGVDYDLDSKGVATKA